MKAMFSFGLRLAALSAIYLLLFSAAYALAFAVTGAQQPATGDASGNASGADLVPLIAVAVLNTLVLAAMIARSRWSSHELALTVAYVLYGVGTFMTQIESAVFPAVAARMGPAMLPALFLAGALLVVPFAPLAVLLLGKWRRDRQANEPNYRLEMPLSDWIWRFVLSSVLYVALYFTFGYFVAWRNPAVAAYYGGSDPGNFVAQLVNVARDTPWLYPFQFLRGSFWALIALPILRMTKGGALEAGVIVGLQFAVLATSGLLLPNPLMPEAVRTAHLVEVGSSNFILGLLVSVVFLWRARPATLFSHPAPILR